MVKTFEFPEKYYELDFEDPFLLNILTDLETNIPMCDDISAQKSLESNASPDYCKFSNFNWIDIYFNSSNYLKYEGKLKEDTKKLYFEGTKNKTF